MGVGFRLTKFDTTKRGLDRARDWSPVFLLQTSLRLPSTSPPFPPFRSQILHLSSVASTPWYMSEKGLFHLARLYCFSSVVRAGFCSRRRMSTMSTHNVCLGIYTHQFQNEYPRVFPARYEPQSPCFDLGAAKHPIIANRTITFPNRSSHVVAGILSVW